MEEKRRIRDLEISRGKFSWWRRKNVEAEISSPLAHCSGGKQFVTHLFVTRWLAHCSGGKQFVTH